MYSCGFAIVVVNAECQECFVRFIVDGSLILRWVVDHVTPTSLMLLPLLLRVSDVNNQTRTLHDRLFRPDSQARGPEYQVDVIFRRQHQRPDAAGGFVEEVQRFEK